MLLFLRDVVDLCIKIEHSTWVSHLGVCRHSRLSENHAFSPSTLLTAIGVLKRE